MEISHTKAQLKLCTQCILPETFPGIKFDEKGICNHCVREESAIAKASARKQDYRQRLDELIEQIKSRALAYDAIMAYSGGKGSSYTLNKGV